jgi:hypothetical protein
MIYEPSYVQMGLSFHGKTEHILRVFDVFAYENATLIDTSKVKLSRYAMQAPKGRGYIALTHSRSRHLMGRAVSVTPLPRFTPGKGPPVPIGYVAGWAS